MRAVLCVVTVAALKSSALAAISYSGGTVAQNFDALPTASAFTVLDNWVDDATLPGWYRKGTSDGTPEGDAAAQRFRIDDGGAAGGSLYSFGTFGQTDRALGFVCSSNVVGMSIGTAFVNTSGTTLSSFTLSYFGEQWRVGEAGPSGALFSFGIGNAGLIAGNWTSVASLDFAALHHSAPFPGSALDGNAAENRVLLSATVSGLTWQPGETLWLRWSGANQPGRDHGFAVDDLSFSAVPAPGAAALLALAALRSRRRK